MRRLFAAIFILLLGAATIPDAAAQNRSTSLLTDFLSAVRADDGRTSTVVLDDEVRDRGRERTGRTEDGRRGRSGRGTVEGRGDRDGDVGRRGEARGRTERGGSADGRVGDDDRVVTRRGDDRVVTRRDDEWDDDVYRGENGRQGNRGGGPAFCRSGEGHPVFGTDWCRQKGFGLGDRGHDVRGDDPWDLRRGERGREANDQGGWLEEILGRRGR